MTTVEDAGAPGTAAPTRAEPGTPPPPDQAAEGDGDGPATSAPPPATATGRSASVPTWVLVVGLAVAGLAFGTVTARWIESRAQLDATEADLARARQAQADLHGDLDTARAQRSSTRAETERTRQDLDRATRSRQVREAELVTLGIDQQRFDDRATALQARINSAKSTDRSQVEQLVTVNTCLNGVERANLYTSGGSGSSAVSALQQVADPCQKALALVADGDGPVPDFPYDFADPSVIWTAQGYYAYATDGVGGAVQVIRSTDLRRWSFVGEALGGLPGWAEPHKTWAPSVTRQGDYYYLYYTVRDRASGRQCISSAWATRPQGPFTDDTTGPLVCQLELGGSIDPSTFQASDGTLYLVWKSEDETRTGKGRIWVGKFAEGFRALEGDPTELLRADREWEGRTIEGPSMIQAGDTFVLFYSGNRWDTADYREGWALCAGPTGPCTKPADNTLLDNHKPVVGPGGGEAFRDSSGNLWFAYHAWTEPNVGWPNKRQLHVERLRVSAGHPTVG